MKLEQKSMTALISAFARAHHSRNATVKIYDDALAGSMMTEEEYRQIAGHMSAGIGFFNPGFSGSPEEALRWIVDEQLSPAPLSRAAFAERGLENAVALGARQYVILGAGYDTFPYRLPAWAKALEIFEVDHPATQADKRARLARAGLTPPPCVHYIPADFSCPGWQNALADSAAFDRRRASFCSLLGLSYYLRPADFDALLGAVSPLLPVGSALCLDYPDETNGTDRASPRAQRQAALAGGAREEMRGGWTAEEMESLLGERCFLTVEHLRPEEITEAFFAAHNRANPTRPMAAFDQVNFCLAVRK